MERLCHESFFSYYYVKVHAHHSSQIKSHKKKSQNSINQGFSYYFCLMMEGSGSGSVPLANGSGVPYCSLYLFYVLFADIKKKQILSVNIHKYLQVVQRQREASDQREPDVRQEND